MSKKSEAAPEGRTTIGKIVGAHGINGTLLLLPLTDFPERFFEMKELVLDRPGKPRKTLKVKKLEPYQGKGTFFLHAEGITDRDAAEALKGSAVTVDNDQRVELEEDEYWIDDIVGMTAVENETGRELGTVEEVMLTGSNDVYLIRTPEGKLQPIPAVAEAINGVDTETRTMTITIPEGLWD